MPSEKALDSAFNTETQGILKKVAEAFKVMNPVAELGIHLAQGVADDEIDRSKAKTIYDMVFRSALYSPASFDNKGRIVGYKGSGPIVKT